MLSTHNSFTKGQTESERLLLILDTEVELMAGRDSLGLDFFCTSEVLSTDCTCDSSEEFTTILVFRRHPTSTQDASPISGSPPAFQISPGESYKQPQCKTSTSCFAAFSIRVAGSGFALKASGGGERGLQCYQGLGGLVVRG